MSHYMRECGYLDTQSKAQQQSEGPNATLKPSREVSALDKLADEFSVLATAEDKLKTDVNDGTGV